MQEYENAPNRPKVGFFFAISDYGFVIEYSSLLGLLPGLLPEGWDEQRLEPGQSALFGTWWGGFVLRDWSGFIEMCTAPLFFRSVFGRPVRLAQLGLDLFDGRQSAL